MESDLRAEKKIVIREFFAITRAIAPNLFSSKFIRNKTIVIYIIEIETVVTRRSASLTLDALPPVARRHVALPAVALADGAVAKPVREEAVLIVLAGSMDQRG